MKSDAPKLSIVVVFHDMRREARRTLLSLSPGYQKDVPKEAYEVIAIDNASSAPLDPEMVAGFGPNFRYHNFDTISASPVAAVNFGADMARGKALAVIVDGARMATPGLIRQTLAAYRAFEMPYVCALSWHLGPDIQPNTLQDGYDQTVEDRLIASVNWPEDGYCLFDIATLAPSSRPGFLGGAPTECSWFCMPRDEFIRKGGFNTAFQSPGGGQCNHEFRNRILSDAGFTPVVLLGEGVFHQFHGGAATNAPPGRRPHKDFAAEYEAIFGAPLHVATPMNLSYFGSMHTKARRFLAPSKNGP